MTGRTAYRRSRRPRGALGALLALALTLTGLAGLTGASAQAAQAAPTTGESRCAPHRAAKALETGISQARVHREFGGYRGRVVRHRMTIAIADPPPGGGPSWSIRTTVETRAYISCRTGYEYHLRYTKRERNDQHKRLRLRRITILTPVSRAG